MSYELLLRYQGPTGFWRLLFYLVCADICGSEL